MAQNYIRFGVAFLLISIFFSGAANATIIDTHRLEIDLKNDGSAHIIAKVGYGELTSVDAPYVVFGNSAGFNARDSVGVLACRSTPQTYGSYYLCKPNSDARKNYSVTFEFDLQYMVVKTAEMYTFSYVHAASEPTKEMNIVLILPEGTGVLKNGAVQPYSPDAIVGSTGRRVTLEWDIRPELGKTYAFTANYEQLGQVIQYYGNYSRMLAIIFALAFVFVVIKYKFLNRGTRAISAMDILKDDERKVMGIIMDAKDKCKQNLIVHGTNFSKAKVSRILSDLEARGLIKKIPVGRTNRIVLAEKTNTPQENANNSVVQTPEKSDAGTNIGKTNDE